MRAVLVNRFLFNDFRDDEDASDVLCNTVGIEKKCSGLVPFIEVYFNRML